VFADFIVAPKPDDATNDYQKVCKVMRFEAVDEEEWEKRLNPVLLEAGGRVSETRASRRQSWEAARMAGTLNRGGASHYLDEHR
jgi:hypothetical protein